MTGDLDTATPDELYAALQASIRATRELIQRDPCTLAAALDPAYRARAHVRQIAAAYQRLADPEDPVDRVMVLMPPQSGKSYTAAVYGPFWWMTRFPRHRVGIASYGSLLAISRGRKVRSLVRDHGAEFGLELDRSSSAANDWYLTSGGGVRSVGVGSGLTGTQLNFLLVDDPHKDRAEADSLRIRDKVHDWWSSTAVTRLQPGSPVAMILTPWNPDDLRGRLLRDEGELADGGRWLVIRLPALCDDPGDPLGRPLGGPLPHPLIPAGDTAALLAHWEDKRRSVSLRDWFALYMCNPQPVEGALLDWEELRAARVGAADVAEAVKHAVAVDPSGGGRDMAGVVGGHLGDDGRLYITDDVSVVGSSDMWSEAAVRLAVKLDADRIICEVNYGGDMCERSIRLAWKDLVDAGDVPPDRMYPRIEVVRAKKKKLLRAEPIAQAWKSGLVRTVPATPGALAELEQEWATWQPTDPDSPGRIDASTFLAWSMLPLPGSETVLTSQAAVSRSQVTQGTGPQLGPPRPGSAYGGGRRFS